MRILKTTILLLLTSVCFAQKITKSEFKKIIKESKTEVRKSGFSYYSQLISNNKDSIFFTSKKIKIYSSEAATREKEICRTIELKFLRNKRVNFNDCQTCNEPSFCYVSTDKNIYRYRLREMDDGLFLLFKNRFNEMNFEITSLIKKEMDSREYFEITMERVTQKPAANKELS
ncbi:hypothetical protein [Maribacter sp. Asnod2-G09]|uniref:hypothetical protein n=1 Tax=Maribacter sp. Asnod2-G09 TaxID=3160577 RepID=UPI003869EC2A